MNRCTSRSALLSVGLCVGLLLGLAGSPGAQSADQATAISKVVTYLRSVKDNDLANKIEGDFANKQLRFDPAVRADDPATAAWFDPRTGLISVNPLKAEEILAKAPGDGANYGTVALAATLRHEYVHKGQPAAMHQTNVFNDNRQTRARETPAYDEALKSYQGWADAALRDLAMVELWPAGPNKTKRLTELEFTLKSLKGSYQDYIVGIRENRNAGNLDPNFEWTGINGSKSSNPDYLDSGGRLDYGIRKAGELLKALKPKPDPKTVPPGKTSPTAAPVGTAANLACVLFSFSMNGVVQSSSSSEQEKYIQFSFRDSDNTPRIPLTGLAFTQDFRRDDGGVTAIYRVSGELAPDLSEVKRLTVSYDHEPSVFARKSVLGMVSSVHKDPRTEVQQRWSVAMDGIPIREGYPKDGAWVFLAQLGGTQAAPKGFVVTAASYLSSTDTTWTQEDMEGRPTQKRDLTRWTGFDTTRLKSVRVEIKFAPPMKK